MSKFGFCPLCGRFGKIHTVEGVTACQPCLDIVALILGTYERLTEITLEATNID